jgi:hypothetical protein
VCACRAALAASFDERQKMLVLRIARRKSAALARAVEQGQANFDEAFGESGEKPEFNRTQRALDAIEAALRLQEPESRDFYDVLDNLGSLDEFENEGSLDEFDFINGGMPDGFPPFPYVVEPHRARTRPEMDGVVHIERARPHSRRSAAGANGTKNLGEELMNLTRRVQETLRQAEEHTHRPGSDEPLPPALLDMLARLALRSGFPVTIRRLRLTGAG